VTALDDLLASQRAALLARERAHADGLVRLYGAAYVRLRARLDDLLTRAVARRQAGQSISSAWLQREQRYGLLLSQVQAEVTQFSHHADAMIAAQQAGAVQQALGDAPALLSASLPPALSGSFASLPAPAARRLIGQLGNGQPLSLLLSQIAPLVVDAVSAALVTGLVAGDSPRQIAREVRSGLGVGLTRALTISRTETLRAYRDASLEIYRENDDVVEGWRWAASLSARTCAMCLAMHGRTFSLESPFASHPNCRCIPVPVTKDWAELGLDGVGDSRPAPGPTGAEWFAGQPEDVKRQILGPAKLAAYQRGDLRLPDLVGDRDDPRWGPTRFERSLSAATSRSPASALAPASASAATPPTPDRAAGGNPPPAPPAAPSPSSPSNPDWGRQVREARLPELRGYVGLRGLDTETYEALADAHMAKLIGQMRPWMRVPPDVLETILQEGRFENRFETGTSNGTLSLQARQDTEAAHFGLPSSTAAPARPLYGYLHLGNTRATGDETYSLLQYGRAAVCFKPSVLARTTFTVGDSMDETIAGSLPAMAARSVSAASWLASSPKLGDALKYPSAPALLRNADARVNYVEAQYHGGLGVGDIAEVVLLDEPTAVLRALLRANKIKWSVVQ